MEFVTKVTLTTEPDGQSRPHGVWKPLMKQRSAMVMLVLTDLSHWLVKASRGEGSTNPQAMYPIAQTLLAVFSGFATALESCLTLSPGRLLGSRQWCLAVRVLSKLLQMIC